MKKTLLAATALMTLTMSASAAERVTLDKKVLGTWCSMGRDKVGGKHWRYRREVNPPKGRAPCKGDEWVEIKQDGYDGPEFSCKTIEGRVDLYDVNTTYQHEKYSISYRCSGEGYAWKEKCEVVLVRGELDEKLFVDCDKQEGK